MNGKRNCIKAASKTSRRKKSINENGHIKVKINVIRKRNEEQIHTKNTYKRKKKGKISMLIFPV